MTTMKSRFAKRFRILYIAIKIIVNEQDKTNKIKQKKSELDKNIGKYCIVNVYMKINQIGLY